MRQKIGFFSGGCFLLALICSLLLSPCAVQADPADPPLRCSSPGDLCPQYYLSGGGSAVSLTEGNLTERYRVSSLKSAFGATIDFSLVYNSYNADGSRTTLDTVLGVGWTHSYNIFLVGQGTDDMFRMDGNGRMTKYQRGVGGTFIPTTGYFETLVQNPDGSFTLTQKDGTVFHFALIPDTPFDFQGAPVHRLTRIVDRNHNTTNLFYANGHLTQITDTYGRSLTLISNSQHKLAAIQDPLGRTTTLEYDGSGRQLIQITDPSREAVQYTYNVLFQLTQKTDRDGRRFTYAYDRGKPVEIQDRVQLPVAALFRLSNDLNWAGVDRDLLREYIPTTTSQSDGRRNVWQYEYEEHGYITRVIAPDRATSTYSYDPATLMVASATDANGHTTRYAYDALGNRIQIANALGHVTTFTYESVFSQMTSMTDPNGRLTTLTYDARGNRIREIDPLGDTREWTYDSHGNILTEIDKNGNVTTHAYDAVGNRIRTTDALGNVTTMSYDVVGNMLSRTDANGHTTAFVYDGLDRLVREVDPLGGVTQTFYNGEGDRIQVIDCNGNSTVFAYDLRRRLVQTIDALGQRTIQTYDGNDNRTSLTDQNGQTTTFQYDEQNRLIRIIDALRHVTTRTYDPVGNLLSETDANGHTTHYAYDELNRRIMQTDAVDCVTRFEYDGVGLHGCPECTGPTFGSSLITTQTDGNGKVMYFTYDGLDRLIIQIRKAGDRADSIDASDAVTRYLYDPNGNRLSITEPNDNTTTDEYDALNRRTKETNAAGEVTRAMYDGVGNIITITAPNGNVTTNTYDARDRLIQVADRVGLVARYTYDCVGNRVSETDGNGNRTRFVYDAIYRLIRVIDPLGEPTVYEYDPVGNVLRVTDRERHVTIHTYDAVNRRISTADALRNTTRYEYDSVGNLRRIIDANGNPTAYEYDGVNRRINETYADRGMRTFTYDCVGNLLTRTDQQGQTTSYSYNDLYFLIKRAYPRSPADTFTYDLSGRMLTAERGGWLVTFAYDGANRVTETTQHGQIITYVYNIPARLRTMTYPGGRVITEQMDLRDRLIRIDDRARPPIVQYTYDLGNRVRRRTYRNGTVANYTYNANNWVLALEHSFGTRRIVGFGHAYDREGNKRFEDKRHDPSRSEAYQYDDIYRLIDFKVGKLAGSTVSVSVTQTAYTLDPVGNWDRKVTDGVTENRTHNAVNEITAINTVPITHDDNGNLQEDERFAYAYDEENRLIRVTRKTDSRVVGEYHYDALGRRVVKRVNPSGIATETRHFYDEARIIEEQNAAGMTQATYVYGNYVDEALTMDRGRQTFFYHQNTPWSVAAVTDSTANVVERYVYDAYGFPTILDVSGAPISPNPWGTPHSRRGNLWMFTGRQFDEETGIYFYRARYYDPVKGRFLQRDPLGYVDGMNLYEYVSSNPLTFVDPFGMEPPREMSETTRKALKAYAEAIKPSLARLQELDPSIKGVEAVPCNQLFKGEMGYEIASSGYCYKAGTPEAELAYLDHLFTHATWEMATHFTKSKGGISQGFIGNVRYPNCCDQTEKVTEIISNNLATARYSFKHYEPVVIMHSPDSLNAHMYYGVRARSSKKVIAFADAWRGFKEYSSLRPIKENRYKVDEVNPLPSDYGPRPKKVETGNASK